MTTPAMKVPERSRTRIRSRRGLAALRAPAASPVVALMAGGSFGGSEADARIQQGIERIRREGRDGVDDADGEDPCLQHGEILAPGGGEDEAADPLIVEQDLDH